MARRQFTVVSANPKQFGALRRNMERRGFRVETAMESIGTLIGSIDESRVNDLKDLEGVASVEVEHTVRVPPPGSVGPF